VLLLINSALSIILDTPLGQIQGKATNGIFQFLGIPYAQPPINSLRWKPPQPVSSWKTVLDARSFGPICYQPFNAKIIRDYTFRPNTTLSEDCLNLNVYSPSVTGNLPVMVWIHGGGLTQGGNSEYRLAGEPMATDGVVVVTINYRLGLFGFLAQPDLFNENPDYPSTGNYGIEDQRMALKWVQANIKSFGGDPNQVTIMGESAVAYFIGQSCNQALVLPKPKHLHKATTIVKSHLVSLVVLKQTQPNFSNACDPFLLQTFFKLLPISPSKSLRLSMVIISMYILTYPSKQNKSQTLFFSLQDLLIMKV